MHTETPAPTDWAAMDAEFAAVRAARAAGDWQSMRRLAEAAQDAAQADRSGTAYARWAAAAWRWSHAGELAQDAGELRRALHWHQRAAWCWGKSAQWSPTAHGDHAARNMRDHCESQAAAIRPAAAAQEAAR